MKLRINTDTPAFKDPKTLEYDERFEGHEICRILRELIVKIEDGNVAGGLHDKNGKWVGEWVR